MKKRTIPIKPFLILDQANCAFYNDWASSKRVFPPHYNFDALYPIEGKFKKRIIPNVDVPNLALNNQSTVSIEGIPSLKDSLDRHLETLLKSSFALADPALQTAFAILSVTQTMADHGKLDRRNQL